MTLQSINKNTKFRDTSPIIKHAALFIVYHPFFSRLPIYPNMINNVIKRTTEATSAILYPFIQIDLSLS